MSLKGSLDGVVSHWCTLIEDLQASPLEFYKAIDAALMRRQVPETTNERVDYRESGALSANREYLHVQRDNLVFDVCGAPFGTGFFVSWWLAEEERRLNVLVKIGFLVLLLGSAARVLDQLGLFAGTLILVGAILFGLWTINSLAVRGDVNDDLVRVLPVLGPLYNWLFKNVSYYRIDTTLMFQKAVHNAVLEVIDGMTATKGLRALGETERRPVMREFYQRKVA